MEVKLAARASDGSGDLNRATTLHTLAELPGTALLTPNEAALYLSAEDVAIRRKS
jgi:hypothetical protein